MRATGRSTRIIDAAIQELFTKGEVTLKDHHNGEPGDSEYDRKIANTGATEHAFRRMVDRLSSEHGLNIFAIDKRKFHIKVKRS